MTSKTWKHVSIFRDNTRFQLAKCEGIIVINVHFHSSGVCVTTFRLLRSRLETLRRQNRKAASLHLCEYIWKFPKTYTCVSISAPFRNLQISCAHFRLLGSQFPLQNGGCIYGSSESASLELSARRAHRAGDKESNYHSRAVSRCDAWLQ